MTTAMVNPGDIGVDYSFGRPDPAALAAAGVKVVCRYIAGNSTKPITIAERDALWAAGLGIVLNWEASASDPLLGASKGLSHGDQAQTGADALGYPDSMPIIVSVDFGVTSQMTSSVIAYMKAFASRNRRRLWVYGGTTIGDRLIAEGICDRIWQAKSGSWSPVPSVNTVLRQLLNVQTPSLAQFGNSIDENTVVQSFPVWTGSGPDLSAQTVRGTMYSPPLHPIVSSCPGPGGVGALAVAADGSFYNLHAPLNSKPGDVLGPNGQTYWGNRTAARVDLNADGTWTITATTGETYNYPHPGA
jgi:hypothetical protein